MFDIELPSQASNVDCLIQYETDENNTHFVNVFEHMNKKSNFDFESKYQSI